MYRIRFSFKMENTALRDTTKYRDDSISPPPTINDKNSRTSPRSNKDKESDVATLPVVPISNAAAGTSSSDESLRESHCFTNCQTPPRSNTSNKDNESKVATPLSNAAAATSSSNEKLRESQITTKETYLEAQDIIDAEIIITDDTVSLQSCPSSCQSVGIMRELKEIKYFVTFSMRKIEAIEQYLRRLNIPSTPKVSLLPNMPLTQLNEIIALEEMLRDKDIETELFDMLKHTGGSKERDCVNRCLEKIFSDYLGQYCSWTGKNNNFKLSTLTLMIVIKRAVRQTFPNLTDESFERCVMNWFQHASTRL